MDRNFFEKNRKALMDILGLDMPVVIPAHGLMQMSRDAEYPFEQERNFFYLSGINEPDWALVLEVNEWYLVAPNLSDTEMVFNGSLDPDMAIKTSGVQKVLSLAEATKKLRKYKKVRAVQSSLAMREGNLTTNQAPGFFIHELGVGVEDITDELLKLRTIKQPEEIVEIKKAIEVTQEAFELADKQLKGIKDEAVLESIFTGYFRSKKMRHAYTPIVAAGANACTLHYTANDDTLKDKGLVLMDIGAKSNYYAADITRTRVLGSTSKRQLEVKAAAEQAHDEIIKVIKPGLRFKDYQSQVDKIMSNILESLKLSGNKDVLGKYFPHAPSHGLGLDVHDPIVGCETFEPGMVITLEPGIYIPEEGIGARHENDLLITEDGVENLSAKVK